MRIDVVRPGASKRETISYRVPTEAEIAATERKERMARQAEEAARSHAAGDPFGSSYWGARLRLIALGAFDLARAVHEQDASIAPDIIRSIVGDRAEGIVGLIEGFARLEARTAPLAGLITAYGITRSVVLGDCDEPEVRVTQVSRTWVEYRNGLGHYMGSSAARTQKTTVGIARKFVPMLSRSQNIDVSALASMNVEAILARMNCDDPWRQRLEDNLVAFFNHVPAVHRGRP